jgi:hypothetical protein
MIRQSYLLAVYEIGGGLWGLYYVSTLHPMRDRALLLFLLFGAVFALLVLAGILELRNHRWAGHLSTIAQSLQVPHIMTAAIAYFCYGPARLSIGLTLEDVSFQAFLDVGGGFSFALMPDVSGTTLGVNLLPLFLIWYIQRRSKTGTASMVSRGVRAR